ncbi:hypothetical protein [Glycomyces sp. NRRL B-16210]|uniref:hypothetical protein n=1 Tax=Glycomyces sp. NRRL B-16210 TaxID=1463821 RepID=UPI00068E7828|nr:hypothetical protein [Glycomyces sp. NRRL B-16210]
MSAFPIQHRYREGGVNCKAHIGGVERHWTARLSAGSPVAPVSRVTGGPAVQAAEFRRVAAAAQRALGSPDHFGARDAGPESWGEPYLVWRGKHTSLRLRAGREGPEFTLDQTLILEEDLLKALKRRPSGLNGSTGGIDRMLGNAFPPAEDWDDLREALTRFLALLPAATLALGLTLAFGVHSRIELPDGERDAPFIFDLRSDDRLHLGYDVPRTIPGDDADLHAVAHGWSRTTPEALQVATEPASFSSRWHFDAGAPGAVQAAEAAGLLIATAKAAGVREPRDLILGGEAGSSRNQPKHIHPSGPFAFRYPGPPLVMD